MAVIRVDASTPAARQSNSVLSLASNTFSPPAGSVIYLFSSCTNLAQAVSSVTDNLGSHLSWAIVKAETANGCDTEIWYASCPSAQSNMTVTPSYGSSGDLSVAPLVLTGAATSESGAATASGTSASGTPSLALTTTQQGSLVLASIANATNTTSPTIAGGQTDSFNGQTFRTTDGASHSWWAQSGGVNPGTASITIADSAPTAIAYSMVVIEVLASATNTIVATESNDAFVSPSSPMVNEDHINTLIPTPVGGPLYIGQAMQRGSVI